MRELLDKNGKRKKKREEKKRGKLLIIWLDKKGAKFARCVAVLFDEAEWMLTSWLKVLTTLRAVNVGAQFLENVYSNHLWNMI